MSDSRALSSAEPGSSAQHVGSDSRPTARAARFPRATESGRHPFGRHFAWGTYARDGVARVADTLEFVSNWVGSELDADGALTGCHGRDWLAREVAATALVPVYYAYFIGFLGHLRGLADGNQNPDGPNLTTGGAALIRAERNKILDLYARYAARTAEVWHHAPLVWLVEGDFVQYVAKCQSKPLSMEEIGVLGADITHAIKSNMPNAVVALNHSSWNTDQVTYAYWKAMQRADYDLVWTTGVGNNDGYLDTTTSPTSYNHATARYSHIHAITGRHLLVDTSFGLSAASDTWSGLSATALNARIGDGVIAANVIAMAPTFRQNVAALRPLLDSVVRAR